STRSTPSIRGTRASRWIRGAWGTHPPRRAPGPSPARPPTPAEPEPLRAPPPGRAQWVRHTRHALVWVSGDRSSYDVSVRFPLSSARPISLPLPRSSRLLTLVVVTGLFGGVVGALYL